MRSKGTLPKIEVESFDSAIGVGGFIDVETTGLSAETDEIIELAITLFAYSRESGQVLGIVEEYTGLRQPAVPVSPGASRVNGLTMKDLKGKSLDEGRVKAMIDRAEFLVAHNAPFDRGFVCRMFKNAVAKRWLCSMKGINWHSKGCRSRGLQELLSTHGIKPGKAHRANEDVKAALILLSRSGADGKCYFTELLEKADLVG